ncbi:hypothetical protein ACWDTP_27505 [Mycobacterium sp. NPDC003449]
MGALFGGEMYSSKANNWSNDEWKAVMGTDKPENYWDQINQDNVAKVENKAETEAPKWDMTDEHGNKLKINEVDNALSDSTASNSVHDALTGGQALNWESKTFEELNNEKKALNYGALQDLATAWKTHGGDLKEASEDFKIDTTTAITGKWKGESASAAEAATKHVTENSIYKFTPSADEIANRLTILHGAFKHIHDNFPKYTEHKLIDNFMGYNKADLDREVAAYNTRYHFDGEGHLLLSNGQYVSIESAVEDAKKIRQSVEDYNDAVSLFDNTYNPTVQEVTTSFPILPPPPDLKFGDPGKPGGPGGPGDGPGTGPGGGPGMGNPNLGGGPSMPKLDNPKLGNPSIDKPKIDNPSIENPNLPDTNIPDPKNPTGLDGLTDPAKSATDAATNAAKDAMGQAMDAAKNAGQGGPPPPIGAGGPPEGVLGLGPKGLGAGGVPGAGAGGGGIGKGAGGIGAGLPLKGMPSGIGTSAAETTAAKAPTGANGPGAGLGGGAGSPGAGAPAAGQRGDQNGKGHQVNKALRRKKNGKDVIGDAEAAVAVVGASEDDDQADGTAVEQPEQRRRVPQRGPVWQPDSAVQNAPRRVPPSPQRGSLSSD